MLISRRTLLLSSIATPAALKAQTAQTALAFQGFPLRKTVNQIVQDESVDLTEKQSQEFVCMVTRRDGRYFWTSRDNIELRRIDGGPFVTFQALNGSGYIRYTGSIPDSPIDYMEHLVDKLFTITYWGKSTTVRL